MAWSETYLNKDKKEAISDMTHNQQLIIMIECPTILLEEDFTNSLFFLICLSGVAMIMLDVDSWLWLN
jgi:hypothetical protein